MTKYNNTSHEGTDMATEVTNACLTCGGASEGSRILCEECYSLGQKAVRWLPPADSGDGHRLMAR